METHVTHLPDRGRYVITADGANAGHAGYSDDGDLRAIMHTWIEDEFEGRGLGSTLIVAVCEDIRASGMRLLPMCPFVPKVLKENPEYIELVPAEVRGRYGLND